MVSIQARIADTVAVLKACRRDALEAGIKIAMENHGGDMHSWECRQLIESADTDFVGCNFDSGNAAWTLEDPMDAFETLGPVTICSSLRDQQIWDTPEGVEPTATSHFEKLNRSRCRQAGRPLRRTSHRCSPRRRSPRGAIPRRGSRPIRGCR